MADDVSSDQRKAEGGRPDPRIEALLDGFPGAALMADPTGAVIQTNAKGAGLEALINHGAVPEIVAMILQAAAERRIVVGSVSLSGAKGEVVLEISVLPDSGGARHLVLSRDMTMDRNLRNALVDSRQRYKDLVEVSSDFAWEVGPDGTFVFVSPRGALDYKAEELVGRNPEEFVRNPEEFSPLPFKNENPVTDVELWMPGADGRIRCVLASSVPLVTEDGRWVGARGVCRDVTKEREHEASLARLRHREQVLNYIVRTVRDKLEPEDMLGAAAAATAKGLGGAGCRLYRLSRGRMRKAAEDGKTDGLEGLDQLIGILDPDDGPTEAAVGPWNVLAMATRYHQEINGAICLWKRMDTGEWGDDNHMLIGDIANQIGLANEQIAKHEHILTMSRTDGMTGMLNRRAFFEQDLPRRLERLKHDGKTAALLYVDMDNFKRVNDVHGHQAGDDAILFLRDMLLEFSRPGDEMARLGGDEFAVWLDDIPAGVVPSRAEKLIQMSKTMIKFSGDDDHPLGISVGVAIYDPALDESLDALVARSDYAMYAIKKAGKGGYFMAPPVGTDLEALVAEQEAAAKAAAK